MTASYVLAIDQGTTSTRAVVFDAGARVCGAHAMEFTQHYPRPDWVEHDPDEIWQTVATVVPRAIETARIDARHIRALGITNQRETIVLWERNTGRPLGRALVWQDRRTADFCRDHKSDEPWLFERTGLVLDPYFSATKIRRMLEDRPELRAEAERGKLACGTIDSFLIWRLTGGKVHATDVSNASRTLLFDLHKAAWDEELCRYFNVPRRLLPESRPSAADYGHTSGLAFLPDGIPITGVAGDQQAALFGQCAFDPGEAKCTYGTGAFYLMHTGDRPIRSQHRLLSTFAATLDDHPRYALEGSVFIAGAAVQWLRDGLKLIADAGQSEALAAASDPAQPILFVPGLVGLGAPHWIPGATGAMFGLTRGTTAADLGRAALEGVAFQVADLIRAAEADTGTPLRSVRVDGGMTQNNWFLQRQADLLGIPVLRAGHGESTALGAAFLAGLRANVWSSTEQLRECTRLERRFEPAMSVEERTGKLKRWRQAVQAVIALAQ